MKLTKKIILTLALLSFLMLPHLILAQAETENRAGQGDGIKDRLIKLGSAAGFATANEYTAAGIAGTIVRASLSLLGIIFVTLIIHAGYKWGTSRGSEEKILEAKNTIIRAIIGLIITLSAWAVWSFIFERLIQSSPS